LTVMTKDELLALLANGRWFAGFYARWKLLDDGKYRVSTNYAPVQQPGRCT
jgi:hypothetical protein